MGNAGKYLKLQPKGVGWPTPYRQVCGGANPQRGRPWCRNSKTFRLVQCVNPNALTECRKDPCQLVPADSALPDRGAARHSQDGRP
jgi:hypothetical protein